MHINAKEDKKYQRPINEITALANASLFLQMPQLRQHPSAHGRLELFIEYKGVLSNVGRELSW